MTPGELLPGAALPDLQPPDPQAPASPCSCTLASLISDRRPGAPTDFPRTPQCTRARTSTGPPGKAPAGAAFRFCDYLPTLNPGARFGHLPSAALSTERTVLQLIILPEPIGQTSQP